QHAEYSPARQRLQELGWSVGTIFAALDYDEMFDASRRQQRLRQIPLENYLVDTDDGWVLRRTKEYRGRVQLEDEQAAGQRLLSQLLAQDEWTENNFLLAREASRAIPHGNDGDLARSVRRKAILLAEMHPAAERWRVEIHTTPSDATAGKIRKWANTKPADVATLANGLADELDALYGPVGRDARIQAALERLEKHGSGAAFQSAVNNALAEPLTNRIPAICQSMAEARSRYFQDLPPRLRLALFDTLRELDSEVQLAYLELKQSLPLSRAQLLALSNALLSCGYASGFLSATELAAAASNFELATGETMTLDSYRAAIARLKRVPGWAIGSIRYTFAEALTRYVALDARAARFSDDLLRGSPLWILGDTLKQLSRDIDRLSGSVVEINGEATGAAVALNPGIARGRLRVFDTIEALEHAALDRKDIAVIPETIAELSPVAGILTLGEGNALSHVQLLARNFGIPNVAVDYDVLESLRALENESILMVVTGSGNVLLQLDDSTSDAQANALRNNVLVPVPQLSWKKLLTLDEINRHLSGKVIGPKAANLGELNRLFPGRVAPAIALPFGIYAAHLEEAGLSTRISQAFSDLDAGNISEDAFNSELAAVRRDIASLRLSADTHERLVELMREQFGEPGSYGVFIRSDTNVEDLPQFTGAGLNETLPNIVNPDAQLIGVTRVWSSVLSPRALAWRSSVLQNPDQIYASVLLMKSVPATKSGVLVTTNLYDRANPGLTASTAWGVGGAVAGEAAETIAIGPAYIDVISEAKSPYQRHISSQGGVDWLPAPAGRVLTHDEINALRNLADEVNAKYEAVIDDNGKVRPWDIEFGFIDGELTLFQIRPLVERGSAYADDLMRRLRPATADPVVGDTIVQLEQVPGSLADHE
ncbi:MAG TPA: PEP/pyruvate-binding domain-containing protein, partial [Woeseiaceae bacterium]|nr:PEP/pyruvate-binding domain-containing protein [Woeseiaceae bacterium]